MTTTNYSLAYTTAITATYSDTNAVQSPFVVKADSDWTGCVQKTVNFNGTTQAITRGQLQEFFTNSGTTITNKEGASVSIRNHMLTTIVTALTETATKTSLIAAYNSGKDFNLQVENVAYTVDDNWKSGFGTALTNNTDIVDVTTIANNDYFRLIFTFAESVDGGFSKNVGIQWKVSGA